MTAETRIAWMDTVASPAGPVTFAVDERGALMRLSFDEGNYPDTIQNQLTRDGYVLQHNAARTAGVRDQLHEYLSGMRQTFDLPLAPEGSDWQRSVWNALQRIPFGATYTYGQIADLLGSPGSARAVGRANATNPIPLVIPCHRVIGADGSLTGFGGGLHIKTALLAHEARVLGILVTSHSESQPALPLSV
ncbi:MAG TPA: methylated-DNA--[protein]-cysteine S-methyltransferase [Thermomicrobiales bacterium]|nr:methylated-DNA--[protein]-cysteine S-methyltransferase [Thermomicrobiales bacterium]